MSLRKFWTFFGRIFFGTGLIVLLVGLYATYHAYGDAAEDSSFRPFLDGMKSMEREPPRRGKIGPNTSLAVLVARNRAGYLAAARPELEAQRLGVRLYGDVRLLLHGRCQAQFEASDAATDDQR